MAFMAAAPLVAEGAAVGGAGAAAGAGGASALGGGMLRQFGMQALAGKILGGGKKEETAPGEEGKPDPQTGLKMASAQYSAMLQPGQFH